MKRLAAPLVLVALVAVAWLWSDSRKHAGRERGVVEAPASARDRAPRRPGTEPGAAGAQPARVVEPGPATVKGIVTAQHGPLWGARVLAIRSGEALATAHTNPNGAYTLTLDAPVCFDLHVEPDPETGLVAARRFDIELLPASTREEDVALTPG
ncbi:MAG: hypothetical protein ACYTF8_04010, partial [Planctomycetota bacterium]